MAEFITAALPFIAIGVTVALLAANSRRKGAGQDYLTEGMCLGLALGAGLAGVLQMETGLAMSLGMMLGAALGRFVPRAGRAENREKEEDDHD